MTTGCTPSTVIKTFTIIFEKDDSIKAGGYLSKVWGPPLPAVEPKLVVSMLDSLVDGWDQSINLHLLSSRIENTLTIIEKYIYSEVTAEEPLPLGRIIKTILQQDGLSDVNTPRKDGVVSGILCAAAFLAISTKRRRQIEFAALFATLVTIAWAWSIGDMKSTIVISSLVTATALAEYSQFYSRTRADEQKLRISSARYSERCLQKYNPEEYQIFDHTRKFVLAVANLPAS